MRNAIAALVLFFNLAIGAPAAEIRTGVWAGSEVAQLPLPTEGYQAYLVGEMHGIQQNPQFQLELLRYLSKTAHVRDIALEEKGVYEAAANAYVDGQAAALPSELCLRAAVLRGIRLLNAQLPASESIRVHFTDIDSPAIAIRRHLLDVQQRIPDAAKVKIPSVGAIKSRGIAAVDQLISLAKDSRMGSELRTIKSSIRALQDGFEVGTGPLTGSPYLEERESAVASNIIDLLHDGPLLVIYGSDHISRTLRKDGGPNRDQPFAPMALRLQNAGVRAFSVITFPLRGSLFWRKNRYELPYTESDGHLESGETLDKVLASAGGAAYVYVDTKRQKVTLPSSEVTRFAVDAFLLFPSATPMTSECDTAGAQEKKSGEGASPRR